MNTSTASSAPFKATARVARRAFDAHARLSACKRVPGLQQIVLVSSTEQAVWACHRSHDEAPWSLLAAVPQGRALLLPALNLQLEWREIYDGSGIDA